MYFAYGLSISPCYYDVFAHFDRMKCTFAQEIRGYDHIYVVNIKNFVFVGKCVQKA